MSSQRPPKNMANKKTLALMTAVIKVILGEVTRLTIAQPTFVHAVKLIAAAANLSLICDRGNLAPIIGRPRRESSRSRSTEWRESATEIGRNFLRRMFLSGDKTTVPRNALNAECRLNYDPSLTAGLCRHAEQMSEPERISLRIPKRNSLANCLSLVSLLLVSSFCRAWKRNRARIH